MTPYLKKSALFAPQILTEPASDLGMVVVIPAYREGQLIQSLESLKACTLPIGAVEVIVVINDSEKSTPDIFKFHQALYAKAQSWATENSSDSLAFFILYQSHLPAKHAGVGLARKIGMDEAIYRLEKAGQPEGLLLCFDADSACQGNYLQAIEKYFHQHPQCPAASIYYEHPLEGTAFSPEIYQAIIAYELHLRYYIEIQRWASFPLAFHTVGSSMVVRASAYQAQGGMNRRKAGEDFYFLHKFTPLGDFGEINTTKVIPSPRTSDRVPFGTGKSVQDILKNGENYSTYAPAIFEDLKIFLERVTRFYDTRDLKILMADCPASIRAFLATVDFEKKVQEIWDNIGKAEQFVPRFYRWFNAFLLMKYVHFARDQYYPNVLVSLAANWLKRELQETEEVQSERQCLEWLRAVQGQIKIN